MPIMRVGGIARPRHPVQLYESAAIGGWLLTMLGMLAIAARGDVLIDE